MVRDLSGTEIFLEKQFLLISAIALSYSEVRVS